MNNTARVQSLQSQLDASIAIEQKTQAKCAQLLEMLHEAQMNALQRQVDRLVSSDDIESDRMTSVDNQLIGVLAERDALREENERLQAAINAKPLLDQPPEQRYLDEIEGLREENKKLRAIVEVMAREDCESFCGYMCEEGEDESYDPEAECWPTRAREALASLREK